MGMTGNSYARLIFQRQYENPSVIEIEFINLKHINIPAEEMFLLMTYVELKKTDDTFYFIEDPETNDLTNSLWIASEKIRWRIRKEDDLGTDIIYGEQK